MRMYSRGKKMQHFVNERPTVGYFSGDEDKMDEQALKLKFQLND